MTIKQVTKDEILELIRSIAAKKGRAWLTWKEFLLESVEGYGDVLKLFK